MDVVVSFLVLVNVVIEGDLNLCNRDICLDVNATVAWSLTRPHREVNILVDDVAVFIEDGVVEAMVASSPHILCSLLVVLLRVVSVGLDMLIGGLLRVWELFLAIVWPGLLSVGDEDANGLGRLEIDQNRAVLVEIFVPLKCIVALIVLFLQVKDGGDVVKQSCDTACVSSQIRVQRQKVLHILAKDHFCTVQGVVERISVGV